MTESPTARSAEIKISFSGVEAGAAFEALELDREDGRRRAIHFWDKPRRSAAAGVVLPLLDRKVILRLRRDHEERGPKTDADMTVKLRPCPALPPPWQEDLEGEQWEFTIEEDRTGPAFTTVVAASLQAEREFAVAFKAAERGSLDHVLIEPQLELLRTAGVAGEELEDLTALGPVRAVRWKQDWDAVPGTVVIEEWTTVSGLRFLEVSVRADLDDAAEVQAQLGRTLRELDITPPLSGETKTRSVMLALARDLLL
ncbi:hypothetical protein [Streptomyces sp. NPDC051183]|uniref:hypothetical protein n=1 Tax=unclassified Streptomyces TaxID=2593676 RepID=UPI0034404ACC